MRYGLECIDVQAAVSLVEYRIFGLEHCHLQDLGALLFAAGKTFVYRARRERAVHPEQLHLFVKPRVVISRLKFFTFGKARLQCCAEKVGDSHAWNLAWILEGQEKAAPGAF